MAAPPPHGSPDSFHRSLDRNLRTLAWLLGVFFVITASYSVLFHIVMAREGRTYDALIGFYWTMETMSTLGYGDIVFTSTLGRMFSVLVVSTGIVFLLILLPFAFVQFFYVPWLDARKAALAPRALPPDASGHVILTGHGPVEAALIRRLVQFRLPYVVIVPEVAEALALRDEGLQVMVGDYDDADTYRRACVERASLVAATLSDTANANVALTVREVSDTVPVVATAAWEPSVDMLQRAGCQQVIQLGELLGRAMARRISGHGGRTHVVGRIDDLVIAEAAAAGTSLVGRALRELGLRERLQVHVVGIWQRGRYAGVTADTRVTRDSVLLIAGSESALSAYDRQVRRDVAAPAFAVVIGGGRVGRALSRSLLAAGIDHRVVEREGTRVPDAARYVIGDATDLAVLRQAGIDRAESVAITTHDDDANVYLALYCRRLRPDMQILSRATLERNVSTLHQAGADYVMSYVPAEANAIFDVVRRGKLLLAAEGAEIFTVAVPRALVGRTILASRLREDTGCSVLAVRPAGGTAGPPDLSASLRGDDELVLIGDGKAERTFFATYGS
jgi:Trk K+ transport system NAD-binding subunit